MKNFSDLSEQKLLALAITLKEEDRRIYDQFAEGLRENYPDTAKMFSGHRHRLLDLFRAKVGDHIPLIRRQDVKGFVERKPVWLSRPSGLDKVREQAELMEAETKRFYARAARRSQDATIRQLLGDLAAEERWHEAKAPLPSGAGRPACLRHRHPDRQLVGLARWSGTVSPEAEGLTTRVSAPSVDSSLGTKLLPAVLSVIAGSVDVIGFLGLGGLFTAHITWPRTSSPVGKRRSRTCCRFRSSWWCSA